MVDRKLIAVAGDSTILALECICMCMVVAQMSGGNHPKNLISTQSRALSCQILELLMSKLNVSVRVTLNPLRNLSELPLKAFYRFVLPESGAKGGVLWWGCLCVFCLLKFLMSIFCKLAAVPFIKMPAPKNSICRRGIIVRYQPGGSVRRPARRADPDPGHGRARALARGARGGRR